MAYVLLNAKGVLVADPSELAEEKKSMNLYLGMGE
jgi:hypothetical protein